METIIISLGGSLIVPDTIDIEFLKEFKKLILVHVEKGKKFVIITGGGKICRRYQEAAEEMGINSHERDLIGIYSTRFNAEFLRILFGTLAANDIILDPNLPISADKPIIIGGGHTPGNSTDHVAVTIAKQLGAKKIINLSNIDYAYDKDPNKYSDAKKIEKISWKDYRALIPKEWNPGLSTPFDPIASEMAQKEKIEVVIMNGKNMPNLDNCLHGKEFDGTHIR